MTRVLGSGTYPRNDQAKVCLTILLRRNSQVDQVDGTIKRDGITKSCTPLKAPIDLRPKRNLVVERRLKDRLVRNFNVWLFQNYML
jgi:hypothetical protein